MTFQPEILNSDTARDSSARDNEILAVNQRMLDSVVAGDWATYASTCSSDLSCFEAETNGVLVEGLQFHRFYFSPSNQFAHSNQAPSPTSAVQVTMVRPHVRWLSEDVAVLSYTRLTQRTVGGDAITNSCCETRIWQRLQGQWLQVHVHRS